MISLWHSVVSRRSRGPIDNILFGAPLWPVANHSVAFRILPVFRIVWNEWYCVLYYFNCAVYWLGINTNVISWYRTIVGHVWSAYFMQYRFDLHSEVLRFAGHTTGPFFLHCRLIAQQPTAFTRWHLRRWWEAEPLSLYCHSPWMCIVCHITPMVCFRENAYIAILAADSKRSVRLGGMDRDEGLSISVRLAMCLVKRERDPLGWRASGLTPELSVHLVLVPPLLVPQPSPAEASQSTTKKHLTPKQLIQKVFWRILVEIVVLNGILKAYPILTSRKGLFPRWRPRWVSRSYNSHISITIQSRNVVFWDFGINKAMQSPKLSTANYYWYIQDGGI